MVIAQKMRGRVRESGINPIRGSKTLYDYLLGNRFVQKLSVINYSAKSGEISTTRFEVTFAVNERDVVSPRIIANKGKGNNLVYTVEFLCAPDLMETLDNCFAKNNAIKEVTIAKNGSDLYYMNLDTLMDVLKRITSCLKR